MGKTPKQLFFFPKRHQSQANEFTGSDYHCKENWALKNDETDI